MTHSVVIVDDHTLIAKALTGIIENFKGFEVLYEVENGKLLIERFAIRKHVPDIVLLDIAMPVMNGFDTAVWIKLHHPEILIMALSMQDDDESLIKMIKSGAKGYLHKHAYPQELEEALNGLLKKGFYYPDWAASKLLNNISRDEDLRKNSILISDREKEFLQYAATEMTYKEIADEMNCSPRTVEGYRNSLFEKLDLRTRVGLVVYAIKHGIIDIR